MKLKAMSFNLRYDNAGDGINAFSSRYPRAIRIIEDERPDIIGFQEVTDSMRALLRKELKDYTIVGCGRDKDYHGESTLIAYRTSDFEMIRCENLWLSADPHQPGSHFGEDHSNCPRMFTSVLLKHNEIEAPFTLICTHLDHVGSRARMVEAKALCEYISAHTEKCVLVGDFNATPDEPEIGFICDFFASRGGKDCTSGIAPTFHDFGRLPPEKQVKIDYIFSDGKCDEAYLVEDTPVNGQYYSDHNAVCAYIVL